MKHSVYNHCGMLLATFTTPGEALRYARSLPIPLGANVRPHGDTYHHICNIAEDWGLMHGTASHAWFDRSVHITLGDFPEGYNTHNS